MATWNAALNALMSITVALWLACLLVHVALQIHLVILRRRAKREREDAGLFAARITALAYSTYAANLACIAEERERRRAIAERLRDEMMRLSPIAWAKYADKAPEDMAETMFLESPEDF